MTDLTSALLEAAKTRILSLRSIVLLDWHDGPIEGIVEVENPVSYWHFRLFAERPLSDEPDERIYALSLISERAIDPVRSAVDDFGQKPLVWPFEKDDSHREVEALVDSAIALADAPSLLVDSVDFRTIKGIWRLVSWPVRAQ